jgi:hypothetical protein
MTSGDLNRPIVDEFFNPCSFDLGKRFFEQVVQFNPQGGTQQGRRRGVGLADSSKPTRPPTMGFHFNAIGTPSPELGKKLRWPAEGSQFSWQVKQSNTSTTKPNAWPGARGRYQEESASKQRTCFEDMHLACLSPEHVSLFEATLAIPSKGAVEKRFRL